MAQTSVVHLTDAASQLEKTTYVLTNPVQGPSGRCGDRLAGGQFICGGHARRAIVAKRPDWFFKEASAPSTSADVGKVVRTNNVGAVALPETRRSLL